MLFKISKLQKSEGLLKQDTFLLSTQIGNWNLSQEVNAYSLEKLRDEINDVLGFQSIADLYNCDIEQAEKIFKYNQKQNRCKQCQFKDKSCFECVIVCQSPLEQDLLLAFHSKTITPRLQLRINKDGSIHPMTEPIDKLNILTLPDFYLELNNKKLCIYADGHTYHERTEYQALRDRSIDRELQVLGFEVLRYTGKEIRDNVTKVVDDIIKRLS